MAINIPEPKRRHWSLQFLRKGIESFHDLHKLILSSIVVTLFSAVISYSIPLGSSLPRNVSQYGAESIFSFLNTLVLVTLFGVFYMMAIALPIALAGMAICYYCTPALKKNYDQSDNNKKKISYAWIGYAIGFIIGIEVILTYFLAPAQGSDGFTFVSVGTFAGFVSSIIISRTSIQRSGSIRS